MKPENKRKYIIVAVVILILIIIVGVAFICDRKDKANPVEKPGLHIEQGAAAAEEAKKPAAAEKPEPKPEPEEPPRPIGNSIN